MGILVAIGLVLVIALPVGFYLRVVLPHARKTDHRYQAREKSKLRAKAFAEIMDRSRVVSFDCESAGYEASARELIALTGMPIEFSCAIIASGARELVARHGDLLSDKTVEPDDYVEAHALVQVLDGVLSGPRKLVEVYLTSDHHAHVVYATVEERGRLRGANLLKPF